MPTIAQPSSARAAQQLKDSLGAAAAFAGGGTVLQLAWGEVAPALTLIAVAHLPEAQGIALAGSALRIGAANRLETVRRDPLVQRHAPLLAQACETLAAMSVRHLATLGGNAGWGCGDTLAALLALDALAEQGDGTLVPLADWLRAPRLLVALHVPSTDDSAWTAFEKVGHRAAFSPTRLALAMHAQRQGTGFSLRLAVTGAGLPARRLHRVEQALQGVPAAQWAPLLPAACAAEFSDAGLARLAARLLAGHLGALA